MLRKLLLFTFCLLFIFNVSAAWPEPRNIIILIGDGMGFEHVKAAGMYANGSEGTLLFESFPYQAEMTTYSADSLVTDSAASSTAMATATKVNNGVISMAIPGDPSSELETLLEYFSAQGKSAGLVTTTFITHGTPAAFGAHEPSRGNYDEIALDYLIQTRPNVLFGGGDNGISVNAATAADYTVVTYRVGMQGLNTDIETIVSGQFGIDHMPYEYDYSIGIDSGYDSLPHLSEMTETALDILNNDPDGFFLMVEGGRIDHAAHDSKIEKTIFEIIEFAKTVQIVMDWAQGRSDTLILVTADHETGGLDVVQDNGPGIFPDVLWNAPGGHTNAKVPVYAWGMNANIVSGVMDNTDIYNVATSSIPDISLSLLNINFADITEGSNSAPETVTISNTGSGDLVVSDIQLTGTDPEEFILDVNGGQNPCGVLSPTIEMGGLCTVTITFSPATTGVMAANLEISSNDPDPDEAILNVALSGIGTAEPNSPPSFPQLTLPAVGQTGMGPDVEFRWVESEDPDSDIVTYTLYVCEDENFTQDCSITNGIMASLNKKGIFYAGTGAGLFFIGIILAGDIRGRKRTALFIAIILTTATLIISCGGGGGGSGGGSTDTTPPTIPTGVVANTVSTSRIDLSWNASTDNTGTTGYNIYRDTVYLKSVTGTTTSDTGLSTSTQYCYTVSAYDNAGNKSGQSNPAECAITSPSGNEISQIVSGLSAGITYYWKVVANDGNGGETESEVRSFSTR